MLQKYFPIVGEVNSPLAACAALGLTAGAVSVVINGISNEVLETLLWEGVEETPIHKKEVEVAISELEAARKKASKQARTLRYRAACAARVARMVSKASRQVKAVKRPLAKGTARALTGLSLNICRQKVAKTQTAVYAANTTFNTACAAVESAIQGGDIRVIRSSVAILKASVRELEIAHLNFRFAREMLSIALARHSA